MEHVLYKFLFDDAAEFISELADAGFHITPLEQRPYDSTVYRDGEMRVM